MAKSCLRIGRGMYATSVVLEYARRVWVAIKALIHRVGLNAANVHLVI